MIHILLLIFIDVLQADVIPSGLSNDIREEHIVKVGDTKDIEAKVAEDSMYEQVVDATPKASKPKTRKVGIALQTLGFDILPYFVLSLVPYFVVLFFSDEIFNKKMVSGPISYQYTITTNIGMGILSIIFFSNMPLTITLYSILLPIVDYARYRYYFTDNYHSFEQYISNAQGIYKTYNVLIGVCSVVCTVRDAFCKIPKMRRFCKAGYASRLDYQPTNCTEIDMRAKILLGSDVYTRPKQQTIDDDQDTDTDTDTDIGTVEDPETIEQVIIEKVIDIDSTRNAMSETKTE